MKRMIAFILFSFLLIGTTFYSKQEDKLFSCAQNIVVVSSQPIQNKENFSSGQDYYAVYQKSEFEQLLSKIDEIDIKGLNLYFPPEVPFEFFQSHIQYLSNCTLLEGSEIYYGYYNGYRDFSWIENKKNNVQLVKTSNGWILGLPLILTGF